MTYCHEKGIPHSEFLKWSPLDRAKVIAFMGFQGAQCALCGTAPWEWEENRFAYEPEAHMCQGCYLKQSYQESLGNTLPGTTVELAKVTPKRRAQQELSEEKRRRRKRE